MSTTNFLPAAVEHLYTPLKELELSTLNGDTPIITDFLSPQDLQVT